MLKKARLVGRPSGSQKQATRITPTVTSVKPVLRWFLRFSFPFLPADARHGLVMDGTRRLGGSESFI